MRVKKIIPLVLSLDSTDIRWETGHICHPRVIITRTFGVGTCTLYEQPRIYQKMNFVENIRRCDSCVEKNELASVITSIYVFAAIPETGTCERLDGEGQGENGDGR